MSTGNDIQVLIVDDSAVVRQVLTSVLEREPGIHVMGCAADPIFAMERMNKNQPDVVILDVEMPRMDGVTFLKKLMSVRPTPVVICSTLPQRGAETTMEAMGAGAVAFVTKPNSGLKTFLEGDAGEIVQHMPEKFTAAFAARLNSVCEAEVIEATDGDRVLPGRILIAPGGLHMTVVRCPVRGQISDGPRVNRHKPSVDILFQSVASNAGRNALGVIMTGMGDDGARGLLQMREAGAQTIGQDETTCVVHGMPAVAKKLGAVEREVTLSAIPMLIEKCATKT